MHVRIQLLLCWSILPIYHFAHAASCLPCVGSSLRNGVQVVRDTYEARQETEEDCTSLQEQTVSDAHHIHPTLHHHSTIQSSSYLPIYVRMYVAMWNIRMYKRIHTVWGGWSCKWSAWVWIIEYTNTSLLDSRQNFTCHNLHPGAVQTYVHTYIRTWCCCVHDDVRDGWHVALNQEEVVVVMCSILLKQPFCFL